MKLRLLALAVTALAVVLPESAARADHLPYRVEWGTSTPASGSVVAGTLSVDAQTSYDTPLVKVVSVRAELLSGYDTSVWVLCRRDYSAPVSPAVVRFTFDTTHVPGPTASTCDGGTTLPSGSDLLRNGRYTLRIVSRDTTPLQDDATVERPYVFANLPAAPSGVSASFDAAEQKMRVKWSAGPEPDLAGYRVQQCRTSSTAISCTTWSDAVETGSDSTSVLLEVTGAGVYRYRVVASRSAGVTDAGPVESSPSDATSPVVLASSEAGGSGGGSDSGGGGSELPRGSTGSSGTSPGSNGSGSPGSGGSSGTTVPGSTSHTSGSLAPRLIERTWVDDSGYSESLPYVKGQNEESGAAGPIPGSDGNDGLAGLLVPLAAGSVLIVFALQMRYLNQRAAREAAQLP